jgi:hypothetical protein
MYDPRTKRLVVDVVFEEDTQWEWKEETVTDPCSSTDRSIVQYENQSQEVQNCPAAVAENSADQSSNAETTPIRTTDEATESSTAPEGFQTPEYQRYVSPPSNASQPSDETPWRYRLVDQLLDETDRVEASAELLRVPMFASFIDGCSKSMASSMTELTELINHFLLWSQALLSLIFSILQLSLLLET